MRSSRNASVRRGCGSCAYSPPMAARRLALRPASCRAAALGVGVELSDVRVDRLPIVEHRLRAICDAILQPCKIRAQAVHALLNRLQSFTQSALFADSIDRRAPWRRGSRLRAAPASSAVISISARETLDFVVWRWLFLLELVELRLSASSRLRSAVRFCFRCATIRRCCGESARAPV